MVILSIRSKQALLRQQWLQDPQEWQWVGIWWASSHGVSLGVRIYSARDQQQVWDWPHILYFCHQVTSVSVFMLIRQTYAKPRMGYLYSNFDVDVEPPCGPGQLLCAL